MAWLVRAHTSDLLASGSSRAGRVFGVWSSAFVPNRATTLVPSQCPKRVPIDLPRNTLPDSANYLVPEAPSALVLCGEGQRVVVQGAPMQRLLSTLIGLKPVPKGAVFNCPADFGPSYALFFNYSNGYVLTVTVTSSGCAFTTNGRLTFYTGKAELAAITALLR
jgi:hypothetical protein